ncbi:dioxygenase [Streptomyces phaeochromogenes]|uniref:dioxygenase n=1 Tax=Streptomyces phaeochromogenes TaxID=1923 RepID=UPI0006E13443|nr:dioxygenase [Streptomyces phaeochromogenes]
MVIHDEHHLTAVVLAETERDGAPRAKEIIQALVRHLHDFAREVRLADEECDTAFGIVTRLMAGSLSLSTLVALMNNGTDGKPGGRNVQPSARVPARTRAALLQSTATSRG